jgi:hypothetical protein
MEKIGKREILYRVRRASRPPDEEFGEKNMERGEYMYDANEGKRKNK